MSSKTTLIRPLSDIRLRDWQPGRVAQLKLAVEKLEGAVNESLAASDLQSQKRTVNDQVPFPINLIVKPGLANLTVDFPMPPGLGNHPVRQLLFYELQYDNNPSFPTPTSLTFPQRHLVVSGFAPGELVSVRVRVVSTLNEVGPWSDVKTVRLAVSPIQITQLVNTIRNGNGAQGIRLNKAIGDWQTILEAIYQPVDASSTFNCHLALASTHFDVTRYQPDAVTIDKVFKSGPGFIQFRYMGGSFNAVTEDYDMLPIGDRGLLSTRPGYVDRLLSNDENGSFAPNLVKNPLMMCSYPSPFFFPTPGVNFKIVIQVMKLPPSQWNGDQRNKPMQTSDPVLFLRNPIVIESIRSL